MDKIQIRELRELISGNSTKVLSIFLADSEFGPDEFDGTLSAILSKSNLFESLHIVGFKRDVQKVLAWLGPSDDSGARIRKVLRDFDTAVTCVVFDETHGTYQALDSSLSVERVNGRQIVDAERRAGLLDSFDRANGMMYAPTGVHYAKTSTAHSDRFIRTSNVLEESVNVALVAFWMLATIWDDAIDQIIVDTSGIYAPALLSAHHKSRIRNCAIARVWTHGSFDGLRRLDELPDTAICVISATTSGTLARLLVDKGVEMRRVLTLYALMPAGDAEQNVLCDLLEIPGRSGGYPLIENQKQATCRYCKGGSLPAKISGDQFVLEPPVVKEIDVVVGDIGDQLRATIGEIVGTGLFKVYRHRLGRRAGNHEIYLDVEALFGYLGETTLTPSATAGATPRTASVLDRFKSALKLLFDRSDLAVKRNRRPISPSSGGAGLSGFWRKYKNAWGTLRNRALTFNVDRVVHTAHPFSRDLALGIQRMYEDVGLPVPVIHSQKELPGQDGFEGSGTIVVASCLEDQQELMAIKRDLRDIQKFGTTWFLMPVLRGPSTDTPEQVRKLIGYGEFGAGTFSTQHCIHLALPECRPQTSWDSELNTIVEIKDWLLRQKEQIPEELNQREELLRNAVKNGLSGEVFWASPSGERLALRNDFTLAPTSKAYSQADIYCVVAIYLHNLRGVSAGEKRLIHTPFARSVLSPNVFTKFNDGVLQAAFLRASRDHELHYGNSEGSASETMLEVLLNEVREIELGRGEALMEFVLALIDGRLTLQPAHLRQFADALVAASPKASLSAATKFLLAISAD
jgi:hypothetical protein